MKNNYSIDDKQCIKVVFNPMTLRFEHVVSPHQFRWSGNMPNSGLYQCIYCGYLPKDKQRNLLIGEKHG